MRCRGYCILTNRGVQNHQAARDHGIELTEATFYKLAGRPIKELLADVAAQQGVQVRRTPYAVCFMGAAADSESREQVFDG